MAPGGSRSSPYRMVALALIAVACHEQTRQVTIGYAFPSFGRPQVEVARDEIAEQAAADRLPISIVFDSLGTDEPSDIEVERAQRMVAIPGLVAVVGHGGSRGALAAAPIYNDARVPQLVPLGTSRLLRTAGPWTFKLAPDDSVEGDFIGAFVASRPGIRSVTLFFVNDEYGAGLRDGVTAALKRHGITLLDRVAVDPGSDLATLVDGALLRGAPDAVICAARSNETGAIAALMRDRGHQVPVVAGDGALLLPNLVNVAKEAADSIYVVAFWSADATDSMSQAFVARFQRLLHRTPVSSDAMEHDGIMLIVHAIREAGPSPKAIADYLRALGKSRPPYLGVTGPITFLPDRPTRLTMLRLSHGEAIRVPSDDGQ